MVNVSSYSLLVFILINITVNDGTDGLEGSLSLFELIFHASPDAVEDLASEVVGLLSSLAVLLDVGSSSLGSISLLLLLVGASNLVEGVESVHESAVLKRVLLSDVLDNGGLDLAELGLNLIGVNDSGEVSAVHHVSVENVSTLFNVSSAVVSEDTVEGLEGVLGPDDESAEVTTGGELEEVKSVNVDEVDTWEVSGGSLHILILLSVDDEGTTSEDISGVSHFALASSDLLGVSGSLHVITSTNTLEGLEEGLSGVNIEGLNNQGELGDVLDLVASSHNQGSDSGCSNS